MSNSNSTIGTLASRAALIGAVSVMAGEPPAAKPANPLSPENVALQAVDKAVQSYGLRADLEMGVLILALCLAMRRLLVANRVSDRGRRLRLIKKCVAVFDSKLRRYVATPIDDTAIAGAATGAVGVEPVTDAGA